MKAVYEHGATTHHEIANLRRELAELKARVAALESATPKPTDDGDLNIAATEIERLEAELAEAHNVAQALEDSAQEVRVELAEANAKIGKTGGFKVRVTD